jgi:competence protein ComGC
MKMFCYETKGRATGAFTRNELVVLIAFLVFLVIVALPGLEHQQDKSKRMNCVSDLKMLGIAYRVWANDHGDRYPFATSVTNGGWRELLDDTKAGAFCWTNYVTMAAKLDENPYFLRCPADERTGANYFSNISNTNISYFVCVNANDSNPQAILAGDRNLGPGSTPDSEYGFSPADGKGNDVLVKGPVCWSLKMHSVGRTPTSGNILLGDGSAQQVTSGNLRMNWLTNAFGNDFSTNTTNAPGLRLIFP